MSSFFNHSFMKRSFGEFNPEIKWDSELHGIAALVSGELLPDMTLYSQLLKKNFVAHLCILQNFVPANDFKKN